MQNLHWVINVSPLRTTAEVHHHDTAEDHEGSKNLLPTEGVHAKDDTDGGGDDGLHVGVHAHQCRTDALLTYRDKEVGDKGGTNNQECELTNIRWRQQGKVYIEKLNRREWQCHQRREEEYPLHKCNNRVFANQRFENA